MKSRIAPLFKWGVVSDTTEIDKFGVLRALSISIDNIAIVFPLFVPYLNKIGD
jgi:hypothetical protein